VRLAVSHGRESSVTLSRHDGLPPVSQREIPPTMREIILLVASVFFGHGAFCLWRRVKRPRRLLARALVGTGAFACTLLAAVAFVTLLGFLYYYHRPRPRSVVRPLFRGLTYTRDVRDAPRPIIIHILSVDLKTPGLRVIVTPSETEEMPARTVSEFAREFGAQAAINANCFEPCRTESVLEFYPKSGDPVTLLGNAVSDGVAYSEGHREALTLRFAADDTAAIGEELANTANAISGTHRILESGRIPPDGLPGDMHPRTAVALTRDRGTLLMVVADGRQPGYSEGVTLEELAEIIREHGGHDAINLDGGGSSAMVGGVPGKRPRLLNSPVHTAIPGRQRPVANHLGIALTAGHER